MVRLRVAGIGISLVDQAPRELVYASFKDLEVTFRDTDIHTTLGFIIKWIQFDNQLLSSLDPIVLYPTVLPKVSVEMDQHPCIHLALVRSKDSSFAFDSRSLFASFLKVSLRDRAIHFKSTTTRFSPTRVLMLMTVPKRSWRGLLQILHVSFARTFH